MSEKQICKFKCTYPQWRMLKRIADHARGAGGAKFPVARYHGQTIRSLLAKGCIVPIFGDVSYWALTTWGQKMLAGKGRVREGLDAS